METKKLLFNWRRVPIGSWTLHGSPTLGRLLYAWLLVMLIGWSTATKVYAFEKGSPRLEVVNSSFDPLTDYNTYEIKLYPSWNENQWYYSNKKIYYQGSWSYSYYDNIDLYLDGVKIGSVSSDVLQRFKDKAYYPVTNTSNYYLNPDIEYKNFQVIKGNISNFSDVYLGINDIDIRYGLDDNRHGWFLIRVCVERHWSYKSSYSFQAKGNWKHFEYSSLNSTNEVTLSANLTAPTMSGFPSTGGTLKRSGNQTLTFTAPSLSTYKSNDTSGEFTWKYLVNLLKAPGQSSEPYVYISKWDHKYASFGDVASGAENTFTASNYDPVTVYPCWEMYSPRNYEMWGPSYVQRYHKYYDGITVPGYPRAINLKAETYNAYSKQVKLTWGSEVSDNNHKDTNGKWVIVRTNGNTSVRLGEVSYSTTNFIDKGTDGNDLAYGTEYTYTVVFQPNGWEVNKASDAVGLSVDKTYTLTRDFAITDLKAVASDNSVQLTWNHKAIQDASSSKPYIYYVDRSTDKVNWTKINTSDLKVTSNETISGSYTDNSGLSANTTYYYRIRFEKVQDQANFTDNKTAMAKIGGSTIASVTTSRGTYSNVVKVNWTVNQKGDATTYFSVQRRPLGTPGNDEGWVELYTTHGTAATYSYDDQTAQPGTFNEYRVVLSEKVDGVIQESNFATCDGFCMARGVVSGRVSFGSGTAVKDVKVSMVPSNSSGEKTNNFRSLLFNGAAGQGIKLDLTQDELKKIFCDPKGYTVQFWVKPDDNRMNSNGSGYMVFDVFNSLTLNLVKQSTGGYKIQYYIEGGGRDVDVLIPANEWTQITCSYKDKKLDIYALQSDDYSKMQHVSLARTSSLNTKASNLVIANSAAMNWSYAYAGNIDEFRVFNRGLSEEEIKQNWNHTLTGTEDGLQIYWPLDEGMANQTIAYDFSKQDGVANGHHGFMPTGVPSSVVIPSPDQLSLMAYTDADGNYMIGGVPFSGDGTNYVLTPTLGIHQFSPGTQSRYFSINSLIHSGCDFEDVSSFPVSGVVYYENTTIPVADVTIKVDGITAGRDGKAVTTNSKGEFTVDVPIGQHFVSLDKTGHTFVKGGRYPEDPDSIGLRKNFEGAVTDLTFYDNTLVTVAGRVAGGDIEYAKPLGLSQGKANIGKAVITLEMENGTGFLNVKEVEDGTSVAIVQNDADRVFTTSFGKAKVPGGKNTITVETDSITGEWVAQLPPLRYKMNSVVIPAQENDITFSNLPVIDASNPNITYTDTLSTEDGEKKEFVYTASAKIKYKAKATLDVTENEDGSFGIKTYEVKDISGDKHIVDVYEKTDGTIDYKFGYPVYEELATYTYNIYARERYVNKDTAEPEVDEVPLAGKKMTIQNQFAATTKIKASDGTVYETEDDSFELDSLGRATYEFQVGYPNIQSPYTRGLTITYENDGTQSWERNGDFKAIVLGGLPTGNNFVTEGPDAILMVLRDPAGTGSSATWSKGSSVTITKGRTVEPHGSLSGKATIYAGSEFKSGEGLGFFVIQDLKSTVNIGIGADVSFSFSNMKSNTTTVTANRDISTSDGFDFNGSGGDVFIGSAKNVIFGAVRSVDIQWSETAQKGVLIQDDAIGTGEKFTTGFAYTQNYVENTLIPNFEKIRDSLIVSVLDINAVARPAAGKDPIYVSLLSHDDPKFGTDNADKSVWGDQAVAFNNLKDGKYVGPSYAMILPVDYENNNYQDMVKHYNEQIRKWTNELYKNEEAKLNAINNRDLFLIQNYSFDAGTTITESYTNETGKSRINTEVEEVNAVFTQETGAKICGIGVGFEFEETVGITVTEEQQRDDLETITTSYTLAEDGDDDYLSVDVFRAPDGYGPIFVTRAGATSCPYQDEEVTKYYDPGKVINAKTVQIEKPEIEAATQALTGIPAGGKGTFQVYIRNNSDTSEDGMYNINVVPTSNPNGLVVKMDGLNITTGRAIMVPAGSPMLKTFTVEQSNPDVLEYPDIKIRIASQCQPDNTGVFPEIADTTSVSVYFQPSCSDVNLATTHTLVNNDTETKQTLSISGYNYSQASLKGIRLQYKGANDADFTTLKEYSKDEEAVAADHNLELLPALSGTDKLKFVIDLRDDAFTDQTYVFRAITVCSQGGVEVNNESEEIEIVRDMTRPQLIATPTPASGILTSGADMTITFNEDIQASALTEPNNFNVTGVLNNTEVAHEVALSLTGNEAAKTDATMDLTDKSFAASMWLNYSTDGTLLQHGTSSNNFTVAVEEGKLAVSVNSSKATSTVDLPKNQWIYLNVSYDADNRSVSAGYASDAETKVLMTEEAINNYDGNGPVSVGGNNLTAKVQELAIWNSTRSMAEAQADMYTSKSQFTKGLLGYWQLNEGRGDVATDKARSRNLTLPSQNAWWIAGDNYALVLDGEKAAAVNISTLNTTAKDDYLVEAWFKADDTQAGVASVLSTEAMDLRLNAEGKMELVINDETSKVTTESLRDGQWHHLAVNVLKSTNGGGIIYIDGQQREQVSALAMPALYGANLMLGAHYGYDAQAGYGYNQLLKGAIDEVRIWNARRTSDVIKNNMYNRVKGNEDGLVAYYPMETVGLDSYHQIVTAATLADKTTESTNKVTLLSAERDTINAVSDYLNAQNTAALKVAPSKTNVQFSFVASERQIKVNLTEEPYKIEGCTIYITAKNVKDIHGNSANPITWSVYVQQNNLKWQENTMAVTKAGTEEKTFTATIENRGSDSESWTLSGLPTWLTANTEAGMLMPLTKQTLTFTVAESLPIGNYETTVFLTGSQNINAPLNITVESEGEAPNWTVKPGQNTMTLVGQLEIEGVLSNDPKDMVAAFRGTECVGVAQPKYFSRYDGYFVMMNIYGKDNADLIYKAYDASTGIVYPSVSISDANANTFVADKAIGSFTAPVQFIPTNEIEQDLSLDRDGWKWFSLYAMPKNADASVVFNDAKDAINTVTDGDNAYINWIGALNLDNPATMYKLMADAPYVESLIGEPTDPSAIDITLAGNGWTWIGYPVQASNSLDAAFASVAAEGDLVKSQNSFSIYTGGEWVGTLTAMQPGDGYVYNSTASADKTFRFPKPAVSGKKNAPRRANVSQLSSLNTPLGRRTLATGGTQELSTLNFESNMTMIAVVKNGDELVENAQVSVYANAELRGYSAEAVRDGRHFLTIGGQSGEADMLTFVVETPEGEYMLSQTETFKADAQMGTMANPVVLQLSEATGIDMATAGMDIKSVQLVDASGRTLATGAKKLYTKNDLKHLPAGVYYQQVTYANGQTRVQKILNTTF